MLAVTTALMLAALQDPTPGLPPAPPTVDPAVWTTQGATIPSLELPRVDDGALVDLAQFRGKKLLLIQFASW